MRVRVRFQVDYDADIGRVIEISRGALERTEGVIPDSVDLVVRSLWDDSGGHMLSGVLVEGRYRIADVRERTRIRSRALMEISRAFADEGIQFAKGNMAFDPSAARGG